MKKKKFLIAIASVVLIIILAVTMIGCDKKKDDGKCDLVFLKINNHMANFVKEDYNFTYLGDNSLFVRVPYTTVLNFTDIGVSPKAKLTVYSDEERKHKISDINSIAVDIESINNRTETKYYLRVSLSKYIYLDYVLRVEIGLPKINPPDDSSIEVPTDNPNGHIWIPDGVNEVTIDSVKYNVLWTEDDLCNITDMSANYIIARDMSFPKREDFRRIIEEDDAFKGILNGNNYNFDINNRTLIYRIDKEGLIENFKFVGENVRNDGELVSWECAGRIRNCVNKINMEVDHNLFIFAQKGNTDEYSDRTSKIDACINYGNMKSETNFKGFISGRTISKCYNVGQIVSKESAYIFSERISEITNCANLAKISSDRVAFCRDISTVGNKFYLENNKNYGKLSFTTISKMANIHLNPNEYLFSYNCAPLYTMNNCVNLGKVDRHGKIIENTIIER